MIKDLTGFHEKLFHWFDTNRRQMPWRQAKIPYQIWISEIMLQQTQVKTVIPYFERFLQRFPTVRKLSRSRLQDLLKTWEGLGYYSRARNIHKAAKIIDQEFSGTIPSSISELKKLPGIGEYTAAAIGSIAFGLPVAAVDGNVMRVLSRLFRLENPINRSSSKKKFQAVADKLLNSRYPGKYNESMMELGALICVPAEPCCGDCPLADFCEAHREGVTTLYPVKEQKQKSPTYKIAIGVVFKQGQFLITRRAKKGLLGGLWEFPGGKLHKGETPEAACVREIKEETNLDVAAVNHLTQVKHAYSHFKIVMEVFVCRYLSGDLVLSSPIDHRWITFDQIEEYPFPTANRKFIPLLENLTVPVVK